MSPRFRMTKPYFAYYVSYKPHYYCNSQSIFSFKSYYSSHKLDLNTMLGRKVNNFSTNKFKFIKKKSNNLTKHRKYALKYSNNINFTKYKSISNKSESVRSIINSNLPVNNRFKLKNTIPLLNKKPSISNAPTSIRKIIASGLVHRSIQTINRKKLVKSKSDENKFCKFYNLFGKCHKGESCKYIHDSNRISICPRFLRGTCKLDKSCPYSHNTNNEKIPLCSFFANGCCNRDNCPYLHVYNGKNAEFCEAFANGYCNLGNKCLRAHLKVCFEYSKTQTCPRGNKCPLLHTKQVKKPQQINLPKQEEKNEESFISINFKNNDDEKMVEKEEQCQPLKIRPVFSRK